MLLGLPVVPVRPATCMAGMHTALPDALVTKSGPGFGVFAPAEDRKALRTPLKLCFTFNAASSGV